GRTSAPRRPPRTPHFCPSPLSPPHSRITNWLEKRFVLPDLHSLSSLSKVRGMPLTFVSFSLLPIACDLPFQFPMRKRRRLRYPDSVPLSYPRPRRRGIGRGRLEGGEDRVLGF